MALPLHRAWAALLASWQLLIALLPQPAMPNRTGPRPDRRTPRWTMAAKSAERLSAASTSPGACIVAGVGSATRGRAGSLASSPTPRHSPQRSDAADRRRQWLWRAARRDDRLPCCCGSLSDHLPAGAVAGRWPEQLPERQPGPGVCRCAIDAALLLALLTDRPRVRRSSPGVEHWALVAETGWTARLRSQPVAGRC